MSQDPEDDQPQAPAIPLGKVFTFNGKTLEPYSSAREELVQRLSFYRMTRQEAAGLLVFVCSQPVAKCVMVRSDAQVAAFLLEKAAWLDSIGWQDSAELLAEAMTVYLEITCDIEELAKLQPKVKGGGKPDPKQSGRQQPRRSK